MADEATNIVLLGNKGDPVECIVASAGTIAKGTLMQLSSSPQTITATSGAGQKFMGILAEEKIAGQTKISVLTHCIADLTCGAAETMVLGAPVKTGAVANEVTVMTDDTIANAMTKVGCALETVAGNGIGAVLINVGNVK